MFRHLPRPRWVRPALVLLLLGLALLPAFLLRPRPAHAAPLTSLVLASGPLGAVSGQTARVAFSFPEPLPRDVPPGPCRLLLVNALTGQVLASKDVQSGRPGGDSLDVLLPAVQTGASVGDRVEVVGVLIALLRPSETGPVASLQVIDTATGHTLNALPAVQLPAVQRGDGG